MGRQKRLVGSSSVLGSVAGGQGGLQGSPTSPRLPYQPELIGLASPLAFSITRLGQGHAAPRTFYVYEHHTG